MTVRKYSDILKNKRGGEKITKKEEEYKPVRGDIVQWVGGGGKGQVGLVVGWAGTNKLMMEDLQSGYLITGIFDTCFIILLRKNQYEGKIKNLPYIIKITDSEPVDP